MLYLLIYILVYVLIIWKVVFLRIKVYKEDKEEKEAVKNYMLPITLDKQEETENIFTKKFDETE